MANPEGRPSEPLVSEDAERPSELGRRLLKAIGRLVEMITTIPKFGQDQDKVVVKLEDFVRQLEKEFGSRPRISEDGAPGNRGRILVVDDQWGVARAFETFLESRGYKVFLAKSGEEALYLFRQGHFDLVFLDVIIRGSEVYGAEVMRGIREITPEAKVVLMTAYPGHKETLAAMAFKPFRFLFKPFRFLEKGSGLRLDDIVEILRAAGLE